MTRAEIQRKYRASHREAINARARAAYATLSDEDRRDYNSECCEYYAANKARRLASMRRWDLSHKVEKARLSSNYRARKRGVKSEDLDRREVFLKGEGRCWYCETVLLVDSFHVDHVIPLAAGGEHTFENVVPSCRSCNSAKRDRAGWVRGCRVRGVS